MTVYIDVLLILNLYINYFIIRGTALLLHRDIKLSRNVIAAAIGAMFSLMILLPEMPFIVSFLLKTASCCVMSYAAFGIYRMYEYIIDTLCMLVITFMYAGMLMAIWNFAAPSLMYSSNGIFYFDIPLILIAAITAAAYSIVRFLRYLSDRRVINREEKNVEITHCNTTVILTATPDTGNSLCDPFSGTPVIICFLDAIESIIPTGIRQYLDGDTEHLESIRLVPCSTVGGNALIPVFKADKTTIGGIQVDVMIGVSRNAMGTECIFDPRIISL